MKIKFKRYTKPQQACEHCKLQVMIGVIKYDEDWEFTVYMFILWKFSIFIAIEKKG